MDAVLSTPDAGLLCPMCFTKADITAGRRRVGFDGFAAALIGAVAAALPFLARAAWAMPAQAGPDWIALVAGIAAAVCGAATIVAARARASAGWLAVGALVVALAGYHLARAAGLIG